MTILEKLCENEYVKDPMEYAVLQCPSDVGIGDQPDYCPMLDPDIGWTKDALRACVRCWLREYKEV